LSGSASVRTGSVGRGEKPRRVAKRLAPEAAGARWPRVEGKRKGSEAPSRQRFPASLLPPSILLPAVRRGDGKIALPSGVETTTGLEWGVPLQRPPQEAP